LLAADLPNEDYTLRNIGVLRDEYCAVEVDNENDLKAGYSDF